MKPMCRRCGGCCRAVLLSFSPQQLQDSYRAWRKWRNKKTESIIILADIFLVYPMLTYLGEFVTEGYTRYVYECKHLSHEVVRGKKVAKCSLGDDRPNLCKSYPYYNHSQAIEMGLKPENANPGYIKGCGYNSDPKHGSTPAELRKKAKAK